MAVQFATIDQLFDFQGLEREARPTDQEEVAVYDAETRRLNALLQRASSRITFATRLARVRLGKDGIPRDSNTADGYARATSAQAVWFEENGDISGSGSQFDSVSLIGVSFGRRAGSDASKSQAGSSRVAPEANEILSGLGIFTTKVAH